MQKSKAKRVALDLLFRALADRTRLRLINLIGDQEICVCYLVEVLAASQPKISRHLSYLRRAGVVAARRDGKWMHYRLNTPPDSAAAAILKSTLDALETDEAMRSDRHRLVRACCGPKSLIQVLGAPAPRMNAE